MGHTTDRLACPIPEQVAVESAEAFSVERVDEPKSEGDHSDWRPLFRPWKLDTCLRVIECGQIMLLEVSVASGDGGVC